MSLVPHLAPYHFFYAPNDIRGSFTQATPVQLSPGAVTSPTAAAVPDLIQRPLPQTKVAA